MPKTVVKAKVKATAPAKVKGKPFGIPMWGWIAAAAVGIIVGYILLKNSGASAATSAGASSVPSAGAPADSSDQGSGVVAAPAPDDNQLLDELKALGIIGGGTGTIPGGQSNPPPSSSSDISSPGPTGTLDPGVAARSGVGTGGADNSSNPIPTVTTPTGSTIPQAGSAAALAPTAIIASLFPTTPTATSPVVISNGTPKLAPGVAGRAGVGTGGAG